MTVRPIVITGEPVLHRAAAVVTVFDDELRTLVADMFETNDAANGVGPGGAPDRCRAAHLHLEDGQRRRRPRAAARHQPDLTTSKIPQERPDPDEETEGCLSVPGEAFPLKRAERARVIGFDVDGKRVEFEATGWFARCMQHEYDHLNGKLYVDRLDDR